MSKTPEQVSREMALHEKYEAKTLTAAERAEFAELVEQA